jgi:hypothetical protein
MHESATAAIVKVCYQGLIWRIQTFHYNPVLTV